MGVQEQKDEHGIVTKNKARLVAQGYNQEKGIDYDETFAPVARMEAIRIFLAFTTYMNFIVFQMDVKSVFLNGKVNEEVYVKQPPGFESSEFPDYVCKLDKALYGMKQAPRAWYETLSTSLIQNNFVNGRRDNTLFIYRSKEEVLLVQVYVDDIIFGSTSYKLCKQFEKLMTKKFHMSMMRELTYFLGLQIKQDDKGISICQEQYARNLLKKYEIYDSSLVKTPMVPPNNLGQSMRPCQSKRIIPNSCEKNLQVVKAELANIATDEVLINRTPVLKTTFLIAWRILFTFMIQGKTNYPKYSRGNNQPANKGLPSMVSNKGTDAKYQVDQTQSTRLRYRSLNKNEGKTSSEVEPDTQTLLLTTTTNVQALLLSDDELIEEIDDDVFEAGDEMDEDIQQADEEETQSPKPSKESSTKIPTEESVSHEHQSPNLNKEKPKPSHVRDTDASDSESYSCSDTFNPYDNYMPITERKLEKHEEAVVSYDDIRASIEDYYEKNVDHKAQTNKLVQETMTNLDKISKAGVDERAKLLKSLNRVSKTLKADSALKEEMKKMVDSNNKTSRNITSLIELLRNA
ncbi:retrovirus-related pol polyprotein from transposon TNT 1-94 [Tanacetum coccineum]|uniref:Retrovirus-related pol polyprotein from transposon TNT 1-94 n=1 Tax=Tanacetum coccineum TaxID=301880 RepID=A0ABQ4XTA1_9ASTR